MALQKTVQGAMNIGTLYLGGTEVTATAAELNILDTVTATAAELNTLADVTAGTVTASKALVVGASKDLDTLQIVNGTGASNNSAILLGGGTGTEGTRCTTALANKNFLEFRCETTTTTAGSDTRALYLRLYINGISSGGGEAARIFTTVEKAIGTAHGAHTSLSFGASGACSGQAIASRNTLHLKTGTATGTVAALQGEIWLDAADSAPPANSHGILRLILGGNTTNIAAVKNLLLVEGVKATAASSGVTDMVTTGCADSTSDTEIRVRINGTDYWLLATASAPSA